MLQMNINPIVLKRYESGCIEHELEDCVSFSASFLSILLLKYLEAKNFINENCSLYIAYDGLLLILHLNYLQFIVKAHFLI